MLNLSFINSINLTLNSYDYNQDNQNNELLYVLNAVMNLDIDRNININLDKIYDERLMPSIFLLRGMMEIILFNIFVTMKCFLNIKK